MRISIPSEKICVSGIMTSLHLHLKVKQPTRNQFETKQRKVNRRLLPEA